ncbi:hypothetical protein QBC46DRAFT_379051 [Diplogelasinospora grovesii]|uniref:Uncharacterized protein n=1 Tax=Diplogelasinospora grovesii TaxID=303347 RepID=A0AAN6NCG7_9PEZI|nr:hypothetical protein QBC46DRAFT_379051 [Diplogelasinospora grovesii]
MSDQNAKVTTPDDINSIKADIQSAATATGVDPQLVLATVMKEHNGGASPSGESGVSSPGLMQDFDYTHKS